MEYDNYSIPNGFPFQLHMIIQRSILIKSWIDHGYNIIMERSLAEDKLMMLLLYVNGIVSHDEYNIFNELYDVIVEKCPQSDGVIFFNYTSQDSIDNHEIAVKSGMIPKFFQNPAMQLRWFNSLYEYYDVYFDEIKSDFKVFEHNNNVNESDLIKEVINDFFLLINCFLLILKSWKRIKDNSFPFLLYVTYFIIYEIGNILMIQNFWLLYATDWDYIFDYCVVLMFF
ncbi:deoxynucleoside kinase [Photorhabdus heterorhabditis]|nr:deoxynucleoside kinase [Photorhabdus heterorhabditis]